MSFSQRSSHSQSWTTARLQRDTKSPSTSHHQVTPPPRVITPPRQSQQYTFQSRTTSPRNNLFTSSDKNDDESILSADSNHPEMMQIIPCDNFPKYSSWLKE